MLELTPFMHLCEMFFLFNEVGELRCGECGLKIKCGDCYGVHDLVQQLANHGGRVVAHLLLLHAIA